MLCNRFVKKDMYPKPTPACFALNFFVLVTNQVDRRHVYFIESSFMAVSLAATKRSATLRRNIDNFVLRSTASSCRVPIDGVAFTASSLVILPSLPVPVTDIFS
jgi:hypothetical protein